MTHATYRMQKDLSDEFSKRPVNTAALFAIMQVATTRSILDKLVVSLLVGLRRPFLAFSKGK